MRGAPHRRQCLLLTGFVPVPPGLLQLLPPPPCRRFHLQLWGAGCTAPLPKGTAHAPVSHLPVKRVDRQAGFAQGACSSGGREGPLKTPAAGWAGILRMPRADGTKSCGPGARGALAMTRSRRHGSSERAGQRQPRRTLQQERLLLKPSSSPRWWVSAAWFACRQCRARPSVGETG